MSLTLDIDKDTKDRATECEKNFACLSNKDHTLCAVERYVHDDVIFIKCLDTKHCAYKMPFGFSLWMCTCPIRKEFFKRYKI